MGIASAQRADIGAASGRRLRARAPPVLLPAPLSERERQRRVQLPEGLEEARRRRVRAGRGDARALLRRVVVVEEGRDVFGETTPARAGTAMDTICTPFFMPTGFASENSSGSIGISTLTSGGPPWSGRSREVS
jgi:hypothetical protein